MKQIFSVLAIASLSALTGCASIVSGNQQSISVKTGNVQGARCELSNNKGTWYVSNTPGSVTVHRSFGDLNVTCRKSGYGLGQRMVGSKTKAMAFGNVVFGGVIGAGVDVANGAAYDYPNMIDIELQKHKA